MSHIFRVESDLIKEIDALHELAEHEILDAIEEQTRKAFMAGYKAARDDFKKAAGLIMEEDAQNPSPALEAFTEDLA